jgi:hypothetical protein
MRICRVEKSEGKSIRIADCDEAIGRVGNDLLTTFRSAMRSIVASSGFRVYLVSASYI